MARACGQCGVEGHNKRTCKNPPKAKVETPKAEPKPRVKRDDDEDEEADVPRKPDEFDEETREAIDWYLKQQREGRKW